jgi:putative membrane protein
MTHYLFLASVPLEFQSLVNALLGTAAFGILGIFLMLVGFKLFEFATRRLDIEKQLENQNISVGIVVGALLIGISLIVIVSMI